MQKITTFLWYDDQAEEAVNHYTSVFPDSRVIDVQRYGEAGPGEAGTVMTIAFELSGQRFTALNGGPEFTFNEAVSLYVDCADQAEVDMYWEKLGDGGEEGPCGWLKDRFGLYWQIVPRILPELIGDPDPERSARVMKAMFGMRKLDVQALVDAGKP
ncbi:3-demethylubiquinone-9 3-methyltransferase [Streptomyces abyssalis]|uniref:3-demethylubiquinone-9 3-methyltransferase n=1 Tax=Streptomyces abyssalis TaxID=933944 RepID=A0A1E7JUS8_9ACTN|nr:VOC family protein [Streptomyces abyssalis]OEU89363.1 3-demethylubiquinone-9 3-methyltransferase [Streptomyces abyssalis]OEU89365.1 3-demethylubiquinone-9 3-methyltransferase [Streptomyces abyssalis]OEU93664.1 3-demethylubiquinone-9 3-methyltransferase [Streptomyces abyssalis]